MIEIDNMTTLSKTTIFDIMKTYLHKRFDNIDELRESLEQSFGEYLTLDILDNSCCDYNLLFELHPWDDATAEHDYTISYSYVDVYYLKDKHNHLYITEFNICME